MPTFRMGPSVAHVCLKWHNQALLPLAVEMLSSHQVSALQDTCPVGGKAGNIVSSSGKSPLMLHSFAMMAEG